MQIGLHLGFSRVFIRLPFDLPLHLKVKIVRVPYMFKEFSTEWLPIVVRSKWKTTAQEWVKTVRTFTIAIYQIC